MPGLKLSESQVDGVAYIEQTWWSHGSVPTPEKVADTLGVGLETVRKWYKSEDFRNALITRGVSLNSERDSAVLNIVQTTVANIILNFHDKRSLREKLEEAGVSVQQYHGWLRTPAFRQYLQKRGEDMFAASDHVAYSSLVQAVESQDVQALKLFFEMRGIYNPKVQVDVNVDMVLTRVVEIVAKHVKDPAILQAIAEDFERLDSNGNLSETPVPVQPAIPAQSQEIVDSGAISLSL